MWQFLLFAAATFLFLPSFCELIEAENLIVETPYGQVEGFTYQTASGKDVEIFLGIPFASPPTKDLRFEVSLCKFFNYLINQYFWKPQGPQNWTKTWQAKEFPQACATYDKFMGHANNEDCLYLNIYKPKNESADKSGYPVMFFVHGGGFIIGDTRLYDYKNISDNIVNQGIIVVVIQYRLGPFGFFSANDSSIPANLGLWDQLEALKFTNKIIPSFNGDKHRITIVGVSAGAGSLSLLTLSEHAYDLYSQVLPISGSGLSQWATQSDVTNLSAKLADELGCGQNSTQLKECLKSKNVSEFHDILKPIMQFNLRDDINLVQFGPKMDKDFIKSGTLEEAISKAPKKPILIGVCSQEDILYSTGLPGFMLPSHYFNLPPERAVNYSHVDFEEFVRVILAKDKYFGNKSEEFAHEIIDFYLNQTDQNSSFNFFFEQYTTLMSDLNFNVPALREANLKAANKNPTFFYVFDYNVDITDITPKHARGSSHGADIINLFGGLYKEIKLDGNGRKVQQKYVELIGNFIKNGKPSIGSLTVPSITPGNFQYLHINAVPTVKKDLWKNRLDFWNHIRKKYGYDLPSGLFSENGGK